LDQQQEVQPRPNQQEEKQPDERVEVKREQVNQRRQAEGQPSPSRRNRRQRQPLCESTQPRPTQKPTQRQHATQQPMIIQNAILPANVAPQQIHFSQIFLGLGLQPQQQFNPCAATIATMMEQQQWTLANQYGYCCPPIMEGIRVPLLYRKKACRAALD